MNRFENILGIIFLFLLSINQSLASDYNLKFNQPQSLNTLPNKEVRCLFQDNSGFMWIGTSCGLYKYDGYNITEYKSNIFHPNLLTNNHITCLAEDHKSNILIGSKKGLNILSKTGEITTCKNAIFNNEFISAITVSPDNKIFIGSKSGLFIYDKEKNSCSKIDYEKYSIKDVKSLYIDSKTNLWIGTWNHGLFRYNLNSKQVYRYPKLNAENSAHVIYEDSFHRIWIGTFGHGLYLLNNPYDLKNITWNHYSTSTNIKISDNYIYALRENKETKNFYIGTRKGISILGNISDINHLSATQIYPRPNSLPFNDVDAIINDSQDNIWIGTLGGGVLYVKTRDMAFHNDSMLKVQKTYSSNNILSIAVNDKGDIYTGIGSIGLGIKLAGKSNFEVITDNKWFNQINNFNIVSALKRDQGQIFFGTLEGLYSLDSINPINIPHKNKTKFLKNKVYQIIEGYKSGYWVSMNSGLFYLKNYLSEPIIIKRSNLKNQYRTIALDGKDILWAGSFTKGIYKYKIDYKNKKLVLIHHYCESNNGIKASKINQLYKDTNGNIWACTENAGLCKYLPNNDRFISMLEISDFPTDNVTSIIQDNEGILWLGSNIGLIKFFPKNKLATSSVRLYNMNNGLGDNMFNVQAVDKTKSGELYFGTHNGYVHFFPNEIDEPQTEIRLQITDIKVNNQSICSLDSISKHEISDTLPEFTNHITIPPKYKTFTIEFSPMTYNNPNSVRYKYRLNGFDYKWRHTNSKMRFSHYSNLHAGHYIFEVKSTDDYGCWNSYTKKIYITVKAPLWKTVWAYCFYILVILLIIYFFFKIKIREIVLENSLNLQRIEKQKNEEVNNEKLKFFTNITHDLYTPITVIAVAIEELRNILTNKQYNIIMSNINRLIRLIQQILEFRKSETGNLKLQVAPQDFTSFIERKVNSILPLIKNKKIKFIYNVPKEEHICYFDSDKIDKIIYNLLSNAQKYNQPGATITFTVSYPDQNSLSISIADNGDGLSPYIMSNLFKRFYDGDFRQHNTTGTGIGLSLVNDLVKLHKGKIEVKNEYKHGVNFIINIPTNKSAYLESECGEQISNDTYEIKNNINILNSDTNGNIKLDAGTDDGITSSSSDNKQHTTSILIAEDNIDLQQIIGNILSSSHKVFKAKDGTEALEILKKEDINIVISDIMMPNMNGYELCKKIKSDINFSHIPVILLTAKTQDNDKIDGYNSGADSYLTKPFSLSVLTARINNLLLMRNLRIESLKKQQIFKPKEINFTNNDQTFLKKIFDHINNNYINPGYSQKDLANAVGISLSTLHRKLKYLTGMTASGLIKDVRLQQAEKIFSSDYNARVSEVAYAVGFNDPRYFSTCYKKKYKKSPSQTK